MPVIICILMILLGFAIGYSIGQTSNKTILSGKLKVDRSDPDGPYLFLELGENINDIQQREYVTLQVDVSNYISQN